MNLFTTFQVGHWRYQVTGVFKLIAFYSQFKTQTSTLTHNGIGTSASHGKGAPSSVTSVNDSNVTNDRVTMDSFRASNDSDSDGGGEVSHRRTHSASEVKGLPVVLKGLAGDSDDADCNRTDR